jgi:hypothetical protein
LRAHHELHRDRLPAVLHAVQQHRVLHRDRAAGIRVATVLS